MTATAPQQIAAIHYTLEVIEADGTARLAQPRKKNLILDVGLDNIGANEYGWKDACYRAAYGTGTTPTKRDSGTVTFTRAAATVTASAGFFEADDVGRLLKFDTGAEMYITAYTSPTSVTVSATGALAASEGTVWYVNQTGLTAEVSRVITEGGGGAISSVYADGVWTRTWRATFPAVGGVTVAREIGWLFDNNVFFGRDLLAGAGVTLLAGQQLRVTVELAVQIGPLTAQPYANVVTGWAANGQQMLVTSAGGIVSGAPLFGSAFVTTDASPLAFIGPDPIDLRPALLARVDLLSTGYTPGSFRQIRRAVFGPPAFNSASVRSLWAGVAAWEGLYRVRLDSAEGKTDTQSLTLDFTFTWGRVLTN